MANSSKRRRRRPPTPKLTVQVGRELSSPLLEKWATLLLGNLQVVTDKTLEDHSTEGYKLYTRMLRKDPSLARCFRLRALTVLSQGWDIIPGEDDPEDKSGMAGFVKDVFGGIKNLQISRVAMFRALAYGFRPVEIIYELRDDKKIGIECFKNRDPERFRFDKDDNLVLTGLSGMGGEVMPAANFLVNTWGSDEIPYGEGLLRELYPYWYMKANGLKILMRFIEKFGTPFLWATYPQGTPEDEQTNLLDILKQMHGNAVGIGPEGSQLAVTEADKRGVIDTFKFLIDEYVDREYAKSILGQTLSTESESGTYALAKFQSKTQQYICEEDSLWHQAQMDLVVDRLVDLNFGPQQPGMYPSFRIPYEENKDLDAFLRAVSVARNDLGLEVSEEWLREQIGFPPVGEGEHPLEGRKQPNMFGLDLRDAEKEGDEFDKDFDKDKESGL